MSVKLKDPDAILDYTHDWSVYLQSAETVSTSAWSVAPTGLTIDSDSLATPNATVTLSGGTAGSLYRVTNRITTSNSRTEDRAITVRVGQR